jgi:CSLREA domain-containing protein
MRRPPFCSFFFPCLLVILSLSRGVWAAPGTVTVTSLADETVDNEAMSLREAITAAAPGGTITFHQSLNGLTITLSLGELAIDKALSIEGHVTVNGDGLFRVFHTTHLSETVVISGLTIENGNVIGDGGGVLNNGGGKIWLKDCTIKGNSASNGGGVSNQGVGSSAIVQQCLISANQASGAGNGFGGGVDNFNGSNLHIVNSTVTGNQASNVGAGVSNSSNATMKAVNCTITGNLSSGSGGGLFCDAPLKASIGNCLVVDNAGAPAEAADLSTGAAFTTLEGNLISRAVDASGLINGVNSDQVGTVAAPLPSPLDPAGLGPRGGLTDCIELQFPSAAVDAGEQSLLTEENFPGGARYDQRGAGFDRHGIVDIGATEAGPQLITVTTTVDETDGMASGGISLREAINEAPADSYIDFDAALSGQTLDVSDANGELVVTRPMTISGLGARVLTVSSHENSRIFSMTHPVGTVVIEGLTIKEGDDIFGNGGGVRNLGGGAVTLRDCTITGCRAGNGGGVFNTGSGSTMLIERCTITGNRTSLAGPDTGMGGGVGNEAGGVLTIANSTISNNSAIASGGGVANLAFGDLTIASCTIAFNGCNGWGGGLYILASSSPRISNTIFESNSSVSSSESVDVYTEAPILSLGGNYVRVNPLGSGIGVAGTDQVGSVAAPLPSILDAVLADNGGPTDTHELLFPSRGVGTGDEDALMNPSVPAGLNVDQRRQPRVGHIDIGAFEAQPAVVTVDTVVDENDGVGFGSGISLREALDAVALDGSVVFSPTTFSTAKTITLVNGELLIDRALDLTAPGARLLAIDGGATSRVLRVELNNPADGAVVRGLTLRGGSTGDSGGGVRLEKGTLFLADAAVTGNSAQYGGGISVSGSGTQLVVDRCLIANNHADQGSKASGGLDVNGGARASLSNTTVSGNMANYAGGIGCAGSELRLYSCTIVNNEALAADAGSAIGGIDLSGAAFGEIADTIVQLNKSVEPSLNDIKLRDTSTFATIGGNYVGIGNSSTPFVDGTFGDFVGTAPTPLAPGVQLALANQGGPTDVHFPLNPGPVVDAGKSTLTVNTPGDQRGSRRKFGNQHDIGAVEWSPFFMDGNPDFVGCAATNGFEVSESAGWIYAAVDRVSTNDIYVFFSSGPGPLGTAGSGSLQAASWNYYYLSEENGSGANFHNPDSVAIGGPAFLESFNQSSSGRQSFEAMIRKDDVGGRRTFVSIVEVTPGGTSTIVAQYPAGSGPSIERSEYLPVITGFSTCIDLTYLRALIVSHLLDQSAPRNRSVPTNLDVTGDGIMDAADVRYLER